MARHQKLLVSFSAGQSQCHLQDAGYRMPDTGFQVLRFEGQNMLSSGIRNLVPGIFCGNDLRRTVITMLWHGFYAFLALCCVAAPVTASVDELSCQVHVATSPTGALISCDGVMKEAAPITLSDLSPGDHLLTANKEGYKEARHTISLSQDQKMAVELQLEPIFGLILIHSEPTGAAVQINGADRGKTPLLITDITLGSYRVRFSSPGYLAKEIDLHVKDRTPMKIDVTLTSDSATLILDSEPSGASVTLNGIARGATPCILDRIQEGESTLQLTLPGFEIYNQTLKFRAGEENELTAVLKPIPAELMIVSMPPKARIYVNNEFRGESPVTLENVEPGEYRIRAELQGHEIMARTVILKHAQKNVEEFRLTRNCGMLEITTEPAGVKVFIDGKEAGTTSAKTDETDLISEPLQIDLLSIDSHEVQFTKKGFFDKSVTISVEKDKTATLHQQLKRRFIPDYEVQTSTEVYRGVLLEITPIGDIKLEIRPGVIKTIPAKDVKSHRPFRK